MACHGTSSCGMAWHGCAVHGMAWHGVARLGIACHAMPCHAVPARTSTTRTYTAGHARTPLSSLLQGGNDTRSVQSSSSLRLRRASIDMAWHGMALLADSTHAMEAACRCAAIASSGCALACLHCTRGHRDKPRPSCHLPEESRRRCGSGRFGVSRGKPRAADRTAPAGPAPGAGGSRSRSGWHEQ